MIKYRPSEVIPQLKKKKKKKRPTFAYVNKKTTQTSEFFFSPTEEAKIIKMKQKFSPKTEKAGVCSKVAITYRLGFWTSKGGNKSPSSEEE